MKHNKNLGQHFISDSSILNKIVDCAGLIKEKNILEIGPGLGTLTRTILERNPKSLTAVEKDPRFSKYHLPLMEEFQNYTFLEKDALSIQYPDNVDKFIIIANLPYNIGTELLLRWLCHLDKIELMVLMFQKEVADRITAIPHTKSYGILSILTQLRCDAQKEFDLPPEVFDPPPKVTSSIIKLTPIGKLRCNCNPDRLQKIIKMGFAQRRKIILTTLTPAFTDKATLKDILYKNEISPTARIEELNIEQLCLLSTL